MGINMKRTWRRKNYFIKKELQGKYIFSFFLFVILGGIFFTIIFSLLSTNTLTIVYENYNLKIGKTPVMLIKEILRAHWIFIVAGGLIVVVLSMFLTHRFAGPLFRFEKSVEEMLSGNFDFQIRLRTKDEGKELAEKMNQLLGMLSSKIREMRDLGSEIDSKLTDISKAIPMEEKYREAAAGLEKAGELSGRLNDILQKFKIRNQ